MEDNRIIELYFARDERAIKETKEKYGGLIQRISYGILGNLHDSEECESDTYLKAWNSIPPTRPLSFSAYLCRIVRNLAITRYRYNKRHREVELIFDELSEVIPDIHTDPVDEIELKDALEDFVGGLDLTKRLIFLKRYFYVMSLSDIAADMQISIGTVKSCLSRMRIALKKHLDERGISI